MKYQKCRKQSISFPIDVELLVCQSATPLHPMLCLCKLKTSAEMHELAVATSKFKGGRKKREREGGGGHESIKHISFLVLNMCTITISLIATSGSTTAGWT
jgi:hypothetical protein